MSLNIIKRLPKFLQSIIFWKDFIEEVDTEFSLIKTEVDKKKNFFNPRELDSESDLRDLNNFFGFVVDTSIFNDIYTKYALSIVGDPTFYELQSPNVKAVTLSSSDYFYSINKFSPERKSFTISFWIKGDDTSKWILSCGGETLSASDAIGFSVHIDGTQKLSFQISDGPNYIAVSSGIYIDDSVLKHISIVVDRGNNEIRFYQNGVFVGPITNISSITGTILSNNNFYLSSLTSSLRFSGDLANIYLILSTLSDTEAAEFYLAELNDTVDSLPIARDIEVLYNFSEEDGSDFGYTLSKPVLRYLRYEAENLFFKVKNKATKDYHEYIFNRIQEKGYVYTMFYDSQDTGTIYRAINYYDTDLPKINVDLVDHNFSASPFTKVTPLLPFAEGFVSQNNLDKNLDLDVGNWSLDYSLFGMSTSLTKHIAGEFMADKLYYLGTTPYLITTVMLEYLRKSLNYARKITETPHSGIGVTAYTLDDEAVFTIPIIEVETSVSSTWTSDPRTTLNNLYNKFTLSIMPAGTPYFEKFIADSQIYSDDNFDIINISFPVNQSNLEIAGTGNGTNDSFSGTLSYTNIDPRTVIIKYTDVGASDREIRDDGLGNLYFPEFYSREALINGSADFTDFAVGTINYSTGAYSFTTSDTRSTPVDVTPANLEELEVSYYTDYDFSLKRVTLKNSSNAVITTIDFPIISITKKEYHASFLIVIDRR